MCMAAQKGHVDVVTALLEHNADPNKAMTDDGATPLAVAAQKGHVDVVTVLLQHNADANKTAIDGATPLHCIRSRTMVTLI